MSCKGCCIITLQVFFSFFCLVSGVAVLGFGVYAREQFSGADTVVEIAAFAINRGVPDGAVGKFVLGVNPMYIICVGIGTVLTAVLGCIGSCSKSRPLLLWYSGLLMILFAVQTYGGIMIGGKVAMHEVFDEDSAAKMFAISVCSWIVGGIELLAAVFGAIAASYVKGRTDMDRQPLIVFKGVDTETRADQPVSV